MDEGVICVRCKLPTTSPTREGLCGGCILQVAIGEAPHIMRTAVAETKKSVAAAGVELVAKVDRHPLGRLLLDHIAGARRPRDDGSK